MGKTFTALAVIKYYENRNLRALVLCPKKLSDNWMTYKANYVNNPIAGDRLRYDVLYHTDLSRTQGFSGELNLSKSTGVPTTWWLSMNLTTSATAVTLTTTAKQTGTPT